MLLQLPAGHIQLFHRYIGPAEILVTGTSESPDTYFVQAAALGDTAEFVHLVHDDDLFVDTIKQIILQSMEEIIDSAVKQREYLAGEGHCVQH